MSYTKEKTLRKLRKEFNVFATTYDEVLSPYFDALKIDRARAFAQYVEHYQQQREDTELAGYPGLSVLNFAREALNIQKSHTDLSYKQKIHMLSLVLLGKVVEYHTQVDILEKANQFSKIPSQLKPFIS